MGSRDELTVPFAATRGVRLCALPAMLPALGAGCLALSERRPRGRPLPWCRLRAPLRQLWASSFATARL
jgi:hypothetical protein